MTLPAMSARPNGLSPAGEKLPTSTSQPAHQNEPRTWARRGSHELSFGLTITVNGLILLGHTTHRAALDDWKT